MEAIKTFIENFLQAEATAGDALVKPDLEDYNQKLETMYRFCVPELYNKLGMMPLSELWDDDFYEEWIDAPPVCPRYLYKISHYHDEKYDDVYVVYVSARNPNGIFFLYGTSFFITKINDELKVVKDYTFGDDMLIKKKFQIGIGLADISFETLQKPVAIERYLPPTHDKDGMEHYEMDI